MNKIETKPKVSVGTLGYLHEPEVTQRDLCNSPTSSYTTDCTKPLLIFFNLFFCSFFNILEESKIQYNNDIQQAYKGKT